MRDERRSVAMVAQQPPALVNALLAAAGDALAVSDPDLVLRAVNDAFARALHVPVEGLVGSQLEGHLRYGTPGMFRRDVGAELGRTGAAARHVVPAAEPDAAAVALKLTMVEGPAPGERAVLVRIEAGSGAPALPLPLRPSGRPPVDTATGLPRWGTLHACLDSEIRAARTTGRSVAVLLVDIPEARDLNQTLGHAFGRRVLGLAALRLRGLVQPGETVTRISGDAFGIVCPHPVGRADVARRAEGLVATLREPYDVDGREVLVRPRVGVALSPEDGDEADAVLRNAELALGQARAAAAATVCFYAAPMLESARRRAGIEAALARALEAGELRLHYQPLVALGPGTVVGAEALLRWRSPEWGDVPPDELIEAAGRTGLIVEVGAWVLRQACAQLRAWRQAGLPLRRVAVNVASAQVSAGTLEAHVSAALTAAGLQPTDLELEITETTVLENAEVARATLERLRARGLRIAVDDFGTGWSSLKYLTSFPVDAIKIDRSFVSELPDRKDSVAIVNAVVALARALHLDVVAEGIERPEQLEFVRLLGCPIGQGYLFGRPLPPDEFAAVARR